MTTAHERWLNQGNPYDNEVEIKFKAKNTVDQCYWFDCHKKACMEYTVGEVQHKYGTVIYLCNEHNHDETAFEVYGDLIKREEK